MKIGQTLRKIGGALLEIGKPLLKIGESLLEIDDIEDRRAVTGDRGDVIGVVGTPRSISERSLRRCALAPQPLPATPEHCTINHKTAVGSGVQGYLTHKNTHPPRTLR